MEVIFLDSDWIPSTELTFGVVGIGVAELGASSWINDVFIANESERAVAWTLNGERSGLGGEVVALIEVVVVVLEDFGCTDGPWSDDGITGETDEVGGIEVERRLVIGKREGYGVTVKGDAGICCFDCGNRSTGLVCEMKFKGASASGDSLIEGQREAWVTGDRAWFIFWWDGDECDGCTNGVVIIEILLEDSFEREEIFAICINDSAWSRRRVITIVINIPDDELVGDAIFKGNFICTLPLSEEDSTHCSQWYFVKCHSYYDTVFIWQWVSLSPEGLTETSDCKGR